MTPRREPPSGQAAGLYVHVPFCSAICPYCDFAVLLGGEAQRARFVDQLCEELRLCGDWSHSIDTVYFGGGTPSLLAPGQLGRILETARAVLPLVDDPHITMEANPEDVEQGTLEAWRQLDVAMLSLGIQSFDDAELRFLGRRHDGAAARRAVGLAMDAGFETVSVDLIYGLPGQTAASWRRTLDTVAAFAPQHLSCYQLTVHEGTIFGIRSRRGRLVELPEEQQGELFALTHARLAELGYDAYEVSNFAVAPGHRSRHNRKYWDHTPYLGVGPSAHSFAPPRRWWNERRSKAWGEAIEAGARPVSGSESLTSSELAMETILLGLRTADGIDLERLKSCHGVDLRRSQGDRIAVEVAAGRASVEGARLRLTPHGLALADGLAVTLCAGLEALPTGDG